MFLRERKKPTNSVKNSRSLFGILCPMKVAFCSVKYHLLLRIWSVVVSGCRVTWGFQLAEQRQRIVFAGCLFSVPVTGRWAPGNFGTQNLYFIIFFLFVWILKQLRKKKSFNLFFLFNKKANCARGGKNCPEAKLSPAHLKTTWILAQRREVKAECGPRYWRSTWRRSGKSCVPGMGWWGNSCPVSQPLQELVASKWS